MPRKRNIENVGLPSRWRLRGNTYYYQVPDYQRHLFDGKVHFKLGRSYAQALQIWNERLTPSLDINRMEQLIDRYCLEVLPQKSARSQKDQAVILSRLRDCFQGNFVSAITTRDCHKLQDVVHKKRGATTANHYCQVLSHVFTMATTWGVIDTHPMKGKVLSIKVKRQRRYIEDWEVVEALKVATPFLKAYVNLKLLTGLRMSDMLALEKSNIKSDGLHVTHSKTAGTSGRKTIFTYDPGGFLKHAIDNALSLPDRPDHRRFMFSTKAGKSYIRPDGTTSGFNRLWDKWMKLALAETQLKERFTERSLRTKVGSEAESDRRAAELLGNSVETVRKHYRELPTVVTPLVTYHGPNVIGKNLE